MEKEKQFTTAVGEPVPDNQEQNRQPNPSARYRAALADTRLEARQMRPGGRIS